MRFILFVKRSEMFRSLERNRLDNKVENQKKEKNSQQFVSSRNIKTYEMRLCS